MKSSHFDSRSSRNSIFNLILAKTNKMFLIFFHPNHGLAPLENWDFWPYENVPFLWSKKVSFLFTTSRNSFFKLFLNQKINNEKF